jgi:hypothetical protein
MRSVERPSCQATASTASVTFWPQGDGENENQRRSPDKRRDDQGGKRPAKHLAREVRRACGRQHANPYQDRGRVRPDARRRAVHDAIRKALEENYHIEFIFPDRQTGEGVRIKLRPNA